MSYRSIVSRQAFWTSVVLLAMAASTARGQTPGKPSTTAGVAKPGALNAAAALRCLAFSPDGHLLAAACGEPNAPGQLILWDVKTHRPRLVYREPAGIPAVAFAPDGQALAIGVFSPVAKLLDTATGKVVRTFEGHKNHVRSLAFFPDGRTLATASYDRTIKLWDVSTGKATATLEGHGDTIFSIAVSPDGKWIASGSGDGTVRVWPVETREPREILAVGPQRLVVRHVSFSPDGRWLLATRYDGTIRLYTVGTWAERLAIPFSGYEFARLAPDGRTLAAAAQAGAKLYELDLNDPAPALRARIEKLIVQWNDDSYAVREAATRELRQIGLPAEPMLRRVLDSPSPEVRIRARRLCDQFRAPQPAAELVGHQENIEPLCFSPDGEVLATGDRTGVVKLWSVKTREEIGSLLMTYPGENNAKP